MESFVNNKKVLKKKQVQFFGGEPFLRNDIFDFFDFFLARGYYIYVSTNGTLPIFKEKKLINYLSSGKIHIRISLDAHKENLNVYRGINSFKKVVKNIKHLRKYTNNISIKTIISQNNFDFLSDILKFVKYELKLKYWNYNAIYNLEYAKRNNIKSVITHLDIIKELTKEKYEEFWELMEQTPLAQMLISVYSKESFRYFRTYILLGYDSKIYVNDQLINNDWCLGTIDEFKKDIFIKTQKQIELERESCKECDVKDYCYLGNYGELYNIDKTLQNKFPTCDILKNCILFLMSLKARGFKILNRIFSL